MLFFFYFKHYFYILNILNILECLLDIKGSYRILKLIFLFINYAILKYNKIFILFHHLKFVSKNYDNYF